MFLNKKYFQKQSLLYYQTSPYKIITSHLSFIWRVAFLECNIFCFYIIFKNIFVLKKIKMIFLVFFDDFNMYIKKKYFNISLNKKYFKPQSQTHP